MTDLIQIHNEHVTVGVSPLGAETQFLRDRQGRDWLWQGDPAWWSGRSPVLFPIVGAAPDDQIAIGDFTATMPKHGFARRAEFTLVETGETHCTFELTDNADTRAIYPFEFALRITHQIDGATLTVTAEVENRSDRAMPFGFGFHPAFTWPLPGATGAHEVQLNNQGEPPLFRINSDGLLMDAPLPSPFRDGRLTLDPTQYIDDAMLFPAGAGNGLTLSATGASLRFQWQGLPNFALWQKPGAPYICLEPWHGTAAIAGGGPALIDRPDTVILGAGQTANFAYAVTLSDK
ncbi:aldose 1-epimerase family protein [Thalassobius sp. Cn5-15]|uniref:aldose 1-epimerase family protein n=1 Tax=Thalassobius sp. Cn5-15 TaxID=2917763 RepID=UPI001EF3A641|nr:aldose 1-epimerase family protein [Thalassobius sp. Cn5-15]MCG7495054.1 aldose 1-epimerase family protein [Thalassobius sp. Cn5-15]